MISLSHYLILGGVLFSIAVLGIFLNRKNIIILLMAIELMLDLTSERDTALYAAAQQSQMLFPMIAVAGSGERTGGRPAPF